MWCKGWPGGRVLASQARPPASGAMACEVAGWGDGGLPSGAESDFGNCHPGGETVGMAHASTTQRPLQRSAVAPKVLKPEGCRRRLERLAHRLIRKKFTDAQGLWDFQLELLELQRQIQRAITATKKAARTDKSKRGDLDELRVIRWLARRLGDAFAWVLLGLDRQVIHALGEGAGVPVTSEEGHGDIGVKGIAIHLSSEGWGFPLIHDVTDCLRIGDITFIKPSEELSRELRTVEVKTRLLSETEPDEEREGMSRYEVTLLAPEPLDPPVAAVKPTTEAPIADAGGGSNEVAAQLKPRRPDRREKQQLRRMSKALTRRSAENGEVVTIPGETPMVSFMFESEVAVSCGLLAGRGTQVPSWTMHFCTLQSTIARGSRTSTSKTLRCARTSPGPASCHPPAGKAVIPSW